MTYWNRKITSMENFKAVGIDYEYYLSLSDCPESLCLSERQMYVLRVQNSYTYWLTRWYNADDTNQLEVAFIAAEIEELLMGCGCGIPAPSFTDYVNSQIYVEGASLIYADTLSDWNAGGQTVISIAPNLDYPTGVPADITKLMCLAWGLLLDVILEQAKVIKGATTAQQQNLTSQLSAVFAGAATAGGIAALLGGAAAAVIAFFGGPFLILGLALASVGLGIASIIQGVPDATLVDAAAIEKVRCVLVNNATGMTPTRAIFIGALTPNGFAVGSNEAKIATIVQPYLEDLNTYLQFIQQMSALYDVAPAAALPVCDTCTWAHVFPTDSPITAFSLLTFQGAVTTIAGNKIVGATNSTNDGVFVYARIDVDAEITSIEFDVEFNSSDVLQQFNLFKDGVLAATMNLDGVSPKTLTYSVPVTGNHQWDVLGGVFGTTAAGKFIRVRESRWEGTGISPF